VRDPPEVDETCRFNGEELVGAGEPLLVGIDAGLPSIEIANQQVPFANVRFGVGR
jgi:hypothetical protein